MNVFSRALFVALIHEMEFHSQKTNFRMCLCVREEKNSQKRLCPQSVVDIFEFYRFFQRSAAR